MTTDEPTTDRPRYEAVEQEDINRATQFYMITCDEGWRKSIVCGDMYKWAAEWLVETLQGTPYAPTHRPGYAEKAAE